MACTRPLMGYRVDEINPETGKRPLVFSSREGIRTGRGIELPCGNCEHCRMAKASEWAVRCLHEARVHEHNCFGTLTFAPERAPRSNSISKRDLQLFFKRLRYEIFPATFRYRANGEYGDQSGLAHYHFLLFGYAFPDRVLHAERDTGRAYTSEVLRKVWPFGLSEIGDLTPRSAGYVCRYSMKKQNGSYADEFYRRVSPFDGKTYEVTPEFGMQSLKPGIGQGWFDRFRTDAFPSDFVIVDGKKRSVPRFYFGRLDDDERAAIEFIRRRSRMADAPRIRENNTPERRAARNAVLVDRSSRLVRPL